MKVLLLGFGKIAYMPYMNFYLDALKDRDDVEYELIYWDRDGKPDAAVPSVVSKAYKFEAHLEEQLPFRKKLRYFFRYRKFALQVLKHNRYDRIIVLHTTPGLTLLDYLKRKYKGRYILDFRDVSYEYIPLYRRLVGKLSRNSAMTFVSSKAFKKFLPENGRVLPIHNCLEDSLDHKMLRDRETRQREVIRIGYWGLIRQLEVNRRLIDALGNDARFELHYYGRMQQDGREMEQYAQNKGYRNVYFHGPYMPPQRYDFAKETDMIHNVYDCNYTMGNAMGNKYYDGVIFGIPQICAVGSYMGKTVTERNVGITISLEGEHIADDLWGYYQNIDWDGFVMACSDAVSDVLHEQDLAKQALYEFIDNAG